MDYSRQTIMEHTNGSDSILSGITGRTTSILTTAAQSMPNMSKVSLDSKEICPEPNTKLAAQGYVEKPLNLKLVESDGIDEPSFMGKGIDHMKLSFHNMGAFQAYQRSRTLRIKNMANRKSSISGSSEEYNGLSDTDSNFSSDTRHKQSSADKLVAFRCPADKTCHVVQKSRRLAECIVANIEKIKFLAGGPCDLCGRDSCDGVNHDPDQPPAERLTQVNNADLDAEERKPIKSISYVDNAFSDILPVSLVSVSSAETKPLDTADAAAEKTSSDDDDAALSRHINADEVFPAKFTLIFKQLELTSDGVEEIGYAHRATKGYKLDYTFLMYRESLEFKATLDGVTINIQETRVHDFSISPLIYEYLRKCCVLVEMYDIPMNVKRNSTLLGNCQLCLGDLLAAVDKPLTMRLLISDRERIAFIVSGKQTDYGYLTVEAKLEADQDHLDILNQDLSVRRSPIDIMGTGSYTEFMERTDSPTSLTRSILNLFEAEARLRLVLNFDNTRDKSQDTIIANAFETGLITEAENKAFYDALQLVLVRNKALRTRQSEIDTELNDRAEWMHEELKWRLTLQEHAILSGKDPETVRWRQWRDENTSEVRFRTIMDEEIEYEPVIKVTIKDLELLPLSQVVLDDHIKLIYVEYAFLTHAGLELETKSLPKTADGVIVFDFERDFDIAISRDNLDTQVLAEHIRTNQNIKFTAVHEPIEDPEDMQTCVALGSCDVNLFQLAQNVSNTYEEVYPLKNTKTGAQDVGNLRLKFDGVRAMRTVALTLLAPSAFKIYR